LHHRPSEENQSSRRAVALRPGLTQRRSGRRWPPPRPPGRGRPVRRPVR
jgi:hypothetical protein